MVAMASPSFPILFVAPERLDDAILASGLIRRLSDEVSHARFTVASSALVAPLFRDLPGLERQLLFEPEPLGLHWFGLWRRTRGRRWGLVLDMRGSRLARLLSARRRAVRKPLNPALEPIHKVVEAARVLRIDDEPPAPFLFTSPETEAQADALMKPARGASDGPILAMGPAADWVGKAWPAERFGECATRLLGPTGPLANGRLLILGSTEDREAVLQLTPLKRIGCPDDLTELILFLLEKADFATGSCYRVDGGRFLGQDD